MLLAGCWSSGADCRDWSTVRDVSPVIWRACEICGSSPLHRLDCRRLGTSLLIVAIGVLAGVAATAALGNRTGAIRLGIGELVLLGALVMNILLRRHRDHD